MQVVDRPKVLDLVHRLAALYYDYQVEK